ncbi:Ig-like domain-containing protein, partial [Streptacidiphilus anmyonensis]|uniref:Ig-like domain-containing protein n=1 Tax=Streptacidiphilus anmyonensis TaxID=405782 RepID=UPI0005A6B68D
MPSSARNRTKLRTLAALAAATLGGVTILGLGATPASAATGAQVVNIADANLAKGYCSTNSAGSTGFDSSCSADGGKGEYWCGDFVSWVWQQAGIPVPASDPASVPSWMSTPGYHTLSSGYTPQPGDAVIFGDNNYPTQGSHIALVTNYSNGLLSDIGGDEGGGGSPWWSTSTVQTDEGNGAAWNPNDKLFAGSYHMWVLGYVSAGASTSGGTVPAGFNVGIDAGGSPLTAGRTVSGTLNLTAMASSQKVINSLTYKITGPGGTQYIDGGTGADNYAQTWDTTTVPNGTYTISVTANEIDGQNHPYGPINFTVNNTPAAPQISVPSGPLAGTIALTASAPGAGSVTYKLDGNVIGTSTSGPDFSLEWDTATATRGAHTLTAVASNSGGTSPASTPLNVTVSAHSNPSLAALPNGGFETAWHGADTQNAAGSLWFASGTGTTVSGNPADPDALGVAPGTSPSIITHADGSWVAAWHGADTDNPTGSLWIATGTGTTITSVAEPDKLGIAADTSPALTAVAGGGWEVAWHGADTQNPTGSLWLAGGTGTVISGSPADPDTLGVATGTSPAIVTMADGSWEVAWHGTAQTGPGSLWLASGTGTAINGNPTDPDA